MSELHDLDPSMIPVPKENSGYTLITPSEDLLKKTTDYLDKVQARRSNSSTAFIPTGIGMLITPDKRQFIFSMYGAGQGNVYDMPPFDEQVAGIETSDVLFCGVTTASFEGYKLLTHAGGPEAVKSLTSRAIDLAKENGVRLQTPIDITISCNPKEGHATYVSGPKGYAPQIAELGKEMRLKLNVRQVTVNQQSVIKV